MKSLIFGFVLGVIGEMVSAGAADISDIPIPRQPGFNLTFKGGTPHELTKEMKAAAARTFTATEEVFPINVIMPKELEEVQVPPITMQSVDPWTVFNTLNLVWQKEGMQWVSAGGRAWVLQTTPDRRKAQAFFVCHLLKKYKIED